MLSSAQTHRHLLREAQAHQHLRYGRHRGDPLKDIQSHFVALFTLRGVLMRLSSRASQRSAPPPMAPVSELGASVVAVCSRCPTKSCRCLMLSMLSYGAKCTLCCGAVLNFEGTLDVVAAGESFLLLLAS